MEAESGAYEQATLYRRTVAQVEHAPGRQYVVDIFRVHGGKTHEYVFHGPNNEVTVAGPDLSGAAQGTKPVRGCIGLWARSEGAEFQVDDVSIAGPDGQNLFANPRAADLDAQSGRPASFGYYRGDGDAEWGPAPDGHDDRQSVAFRVAKPGAERVNLALMLGDTDGYTGAKALELMPGVRYHVSFWVKGHAPNVYPEVVYWPHDATDANDRAYLSLANAEVPAAGPEWVQVVGEFTIPDALQLRNVRQSAAAAPWRLTWAMDEAMSFSAHWDNDSGYTTVLGEGWGQRDYRNSDVGATLPYVVRRTAATATPTAFVSVFEGYAPGAAVARSVRRLPVPEAEAANAVVVAVETGEGTDYLISCLEPRPLAVLLPEGPLGFEGRFALVAVRGGRVARAVVAEGMPPRLAGQPLSGQ
jgi:hypothetical protein